MKEKQMKDKIISIVSILLGLGILGYSVFLVVNYNNDIQTSIKAFYFTGFLGLIISLMWVLSPCIKKPKLTQFLLCIFLIIFSYYTIKDNPSYNVFMGDIIRVLWAFLIVAGPTGICIPEKCKKKAQEEKTQVIEV